MSNIFIVLELFNVTTVKRTVADPVKVFGKGFGKISVISSTLTEGSV